METGKTSKYLKYAIGEIILVMIGILLALQVNTWNNNRELKKEELKMMKSLHKEFSKNIVKFDKKFKQHLIKKESINTIMSIDANLFTIDSLWSLFSEVHDSPTFDPYQGIYNSMINSGRIELISNELLKEKVSGFKDVQIDFREDEDNVRTFISENLHKIELFEKTFDNYAFLAKKAKISTEERERIKKKYIKLIESESYESQLVFLDGWLKDVLIAGPELRNEMVLIVKLLEQEIEKHEN